MDNSSANIDLIRSHVDIIILKPLEQQDKYGYEILKEIETNSNGLYSLKQPTMYSCLKRLEKQGYINSYLGDESNGAQRRYYSLTQQGREFLESQQSQWEFVRTILSGLVSNEDFDKEKDVQPFDPSKYRPLTKRTRNEEDAPAKVVEKVVYVPMEAEPQKLTKDEIKEQLSSDDIDEIVTDYLKSHDMKLTDKDSIVMDEAQQTIPPVIEEDDIDSTIFDSYFDDDESNMPPSDIGEIIKECNEEANASQIFEEEDVPPVPIESFENEAVLNELTAPQNNNIESNEDDIENNAIYARHYVSEDDLMESKPQYVTHDELTNATSAPTSIVSQHEEAAIQPISETQNSRYAAFEDIPALYDENETEIDNSALFDYSNKIPVAKSSIPNEEPVNVFKALDRIYSVTSSAEEDIQDEDEYEQSHSRATYNTTTPEYGRTETINELKTKLESEGIKLRPYTKINSSEFYINNYYYANRTARDTSFIMYALFFVETLLAHFILATKMELNIGYLVLTWGVSALVPIFFTVKWAIAPYYKKHTRVSLRLMLMFGLIVLLNAALIIFLTGFFGFGADYNNIDTLILPIITPLVFLVNIPLYSLVYYMLYKSKRYNLR